MIEFISVTYLTVNRAKLPWKLSVYSSAHRSISSLKVKDALYRSYLVTFLPYCLLFYYLTLLKCLLHDSKCYTFYGNTSTNISSQNMRVIVKIQISSASKFSMFCGFRTACSNMTTEDNGNIGAVLKPTSSSNEDLSEYTDADESISAPTEFLAEVKHLLYCIVYSNVSL